MPSMSEQARQAKRDYEKRWRENNREKVAAIRARYWERRAEKARVENAEATTAE